MHVEGLHHLEGHGGGVPVGEVLGGGGRGSVAEGLDRQQVDGIGQGLAVELLIVECRCRAHGVDEHERGLCGVDAGGSVACADTAQVRDVDCRFRRHDIERMQAGIDGG